MMEGTLYLCPILSFVATWIAIRKWIRIAPEIGILGLDMNKPGKPKVAEMGGICVVFGFVLGLLVNIGIMTFFLGSSCYAGILAALCTVLIISIIGIMDDLLGWKKGFKQWQKPIFTLFAAMPMMVINAGHSSMALPIVGIIDWGILYPLMVIPIGIVGASNAYNMLAGYNGLEAGMGIIILGTLGFIGYSSNNSDASALALCMASALLAFLYFNWYPAKVFPGDTLTYSVGALIACVAIIGNIQKIAVILFLPYMIDFFLTLRKMFKAEAFAKVNEDGSLEQPYDKIYHLTHLAIAVIRMIKHEVYEKEVVFFIFGIEFVIVGLVWVIYFSGLFS